MKTMPRFLGTALLLAMALPLRADLPGTPTAKEPEKVIIGVYVTQIYDLDPAGSAFSTAFWVWARHRTRDLHPLDTIHFIGAKKVESEPAFTLVKGGEVWDQKFFRVVFRHSWELREYPFDEHNFRINFEESELDGSSVVYVPDKLESGVKPEAMGLRWEISAFRFESGLLKAATTYGDPTLTKPVSYWAHAEAVIYGERRQTAVFFKLLIGAYVAVLLALLSYRIKTDQPTLFSARLGLLVGSLFATVVNLRSTESVLGRTDDFTLVDKIHITIALYILTAAFSALLSRHLCEREKIALSQTVDSISLLVTAALFITVNVLMISGAVISR